MISYVLIGRRIAEIRKLRGLSQAKLAELAELSVPYVSNIERAKKKVSLRTLVVIGKVMNTTVDAFLCGNQKNGFGDYHNEIVQLMEDCTCYEKRIIFEQLRSLKSSLRDNQSLLTALNSSLS